jgi:hypothetical protein
VTISNPRIEVKDAAAGGWFGALEESQMPVRVSGAGSSASNTAAREMPQWRWGTRTWLRRVRRIIVDLVIIVAAMTAVPVVLVKLTAGANWRSEMNVSHARARLRSVDALRAFAVPADPAITPLEAGRAFAAIQSIRSSSEFPVLDAPPSSAPWRSMPMGRGMFLSARPMGINGPPNPSAILESVGRGLSSEERTYLRQLATSPAWREFDRVARAPSMDIIGAEYVLPFTPQATLMHMPYVQFARAKDMAYAAVSRAAYHLSIGQRDSAEAILRSVVSYGFNIADNGGVVVPAIGRTIVEVGGDALERFYVLTGDPKAATLTAVRRGIRRDRMPEADRGRSALPAQTVEQMRQELLARATDPRELRAIRYASLERLSSSSCTNVRELLFGPRADVGRAFEQAKRDLARNASERALIDLIQRMPSSDAIYPAGTGSAVPQFLLGTSTIAGVVLRNPRLATCTWYALGGQTAY